MADRDLQSYEDAAVGSKWHTKWTKVEMLDHLIGLATAYMSDCQASAERMQYWADRHAKDGNPDGQTLAEKWRDEWKTEAQTVLSRLADYHEERKHLSTK